MKLTQLAAKPQLRKITLDDEEIRAEYGDCLEFWIWDRQPMEHFIKIAGMRQDNFAEMVRLVNDMVLDEEGNVIVKDGLALPTNIVTKVINSVVETLGK